DVLPAMESAKEPLSIGFWNADPLVADGANNLCSGKCNFETNRSAAVRILDSVRQQICENVSQQALVGVNLGRHFGQEQCDRTTPVACRQYFVHEPLHKWPQLQWLRLEFNLARIKASDEQRFLHQPRHTPRVMADGL